jgi:hypothetical protein
MNKAALPTAKLEGDRTDIRAGAQAEPVNTALVSSMEGAP